MIRSRFTAIRPLVPALPLLFAGFLLSLSSNASAQEEKEKYKEPLFPTPPEAVPQADIPEGTIQRFTFATKTGVFPGTVRRYWVYVPKQYDAAKPAALMVFQDGHTYVSKNGDFRTPTVMDYLIAKGEMPVTIGVFVNPGVFAETLPEEDGWNKPAGVKSNRSVEYDSVSADYVTFLEKELLPEVSKTWNLTTDPEQRAIGGISSGGICAFTAAWERPDLFSKVLSHVGSFTDIRGGYVYPAVIRKTKPVKPIRVFLQDGAHDLDNQFGNWPLANQMMANSLAYMKYDHKFVFSPDSVHGGKFGGSILPDSLRWLWRK